MSVYGVAFNLMLSLMKMLFWVGVFDLMYREFLVSFASIFGVKIQCLGSCNLFIVRIRFGE